MWLLAAIGELTEGILHRHSTGTTSSCKSDIFRLCHSNMLCYGVPNQNGIYSIRIVEVSIVSVVLTLVVGFGLLLIHWLTLGWVLGPFLLFLFIFALHSLSHIIFRVSGSYLLCSGTSGGGVSAEGLGFVLGLPLGKQDFSVLNAHPLYIIYGRVTHNQSLRPSL